ncbi:MULTISPECIES: DMT family transporter [unclassified Lentimicrobium]|uniref:DMT family transporter n=1 Tax=unclassified Lentimicrobium TaxID=2677434 RepID=UPI0015520B85|nr:MULTISPECIES: DMT family transporter [unclassified Lentimicrobium]NPD46651.1 EamA family transporter [Lentimicrobium sp. S6]NPD85476.1 EamA family transporter [Lentimicrobium sp. L6]
MKAKKASKITSIYQVHISVFLFGFAGLFGKWIGLNAITIVWGRVLFASLAFGMWFLVKRENPFRIPFKSYIYYFPLGALLAFHWWSFFASIQMSTVTIGLISFSSFPIFTSLLEPLIFKKPWKYSWFILALLSSIGIYLILPEWNWESEYTKGVFWGIMSGLSFSFITILNRYLLLYKTFGKENSSIELTFFQDLFAMVCLFPLLFLFPEDINIMAWSQLLLLGLVFTALAHLLYINGLKKVEARTASLISNMEPVWGILFAVLLLGESLNGKLLFGGFLILLSAILASRLSKKAG